jgi:hypothetical protein
MRRKKPICRDAENVRVTRPPRFPRAVAARVPV